MKRLAILAAAFLATAATAQARAPLTTDAAYAAANAAVQANYLLPDDPLYWCGDGTGTNDPNADCGDYGGPYVNIVVTTYTLFQCDQETTYRALCDVITNWSSNPLGPDPESCWDTLEVIQAYGRPFVQSLDEWNPGDSVCTTVTPTATVASVRAHTRSRGTLYRSKCGRHHCRGVRAGVWHRRRLDG